MNAILWWLFAASAGMFVATPVVVAWLVVRLPADYFADNKRRPAPWRSRHPLVRLVVLVVKNVVGIVLLLAGVLMLVMPGQGLLTILVGLMLVDFPGKFHFERWLATRQPVRRAIDWLRRRAGREPLQQPE